MEASREQALISIEDLTKVFAIHRGFSTTLFTAVDKARFSLELAKPEIFTLVGESGSGKTTLARMILGMV
ncbi:ATP-binding cassette domain-containing protein, partial [Salmonella sp. SAL4455]|uniref:ATP-binding cassette domain-containing protein n=1 Tax=Salmonella sp. SAL4455 TaxID=3159910 RepID=UPI00397C86B6